MSSHNWSGEGLLALHTAVREGSRMLPRVVRRGILRSVAGAPRDADRAEVERTPSGWSLVVSRRGVAVLAAAFTPLGGVAHTRV